MSQNTIEILTAFFNHRRKPYDFGARSHDNQQF